jgi:hypothetical protein
LTGWQRAAQGYPGWGAAPEAAPYYGVPYAQPYGPTKEQQKEMLKGQSEYLQEQLDGIQKRLSELEEEDKQ